MVNDASSPATDRRDRSRPADHGTLGSANLNPFGDLHTLQHLSARLARGMRGVFEPLLRRELRSWAEPLVVQRFTDYRAERPEGLTAWLPLAMGTANRTGAAGQAVAVIDGKFLLELLDLFFGGSGAAPHEMPTEFTPATEALTARIGAMLAEPLRAAWEPLARIDFTPGHAEANPAMLADFDSEDAVVITRFGIASDHHKPVFIDIIYPVSALKPFAPSLTGKVHKAAEPDPAWRAGLTRAAMEVSFPIRSVLAEPMISLSVLMDLKPGDVIPITVGTEVPVMVGKDRLGSGTVGTSNGKAAIRLNAIRNIEHRQNEFGEMQ
ncbi:FliM/FliN family flagellar motor switch protein [Sphingomonas immobilis]|uniref:Flagellar motor switch protein FliM n=1 Tax=Sphingomonas immobilis TaxID=3063997 RepID=A0ABT8ZV68_9SPHN|nr:FliM/FliN family flagellar motor switch protein [Sphingomonas sp. CA1-15]MDO7841480.1 FliM/FliN family flagellar motor switch protein [Sphingomonas sp. CA1-15]